MKLPFEEFQVKGVLDYFSSTSNSTSTSSTASDSFSLLLNQQQQQHQNWTTLDKQDYCYVEPTSVLDSRRSPSPPISSSTMSSSLGSGSNNNNNNNNNTSMVVSENLARLSNSNSNEEGFENSEEKCSGGGGGGMRMEDWEGQDQSLLRLIMGDVEDPSAGLNKILQNSGCGSGNADFHGGFGVLEHHHQQQQGLNMDPSVGNYNVFPFNAENLDGHNVKPGHESMFGNYPMLTSSSTTSGVFCSQQQQQQGFGVVDEKPQVINPNFMMNHNQVQFADNPSFFVPLPYPQVQEQQVFSSQNQLKRPLFDAVGHNYPVPRLPLLDSGQEMFARRHQQQHQQTQLPLFPNHHLQQHQQSPVVPFAKQQKMSSTTTTGDDASNQVQQSIFDQLYKTAELIEAGNPVQAQGILARLNHQLSPIGKPFHRAAFYTKEALQLMLHSNSNNNLNAFSPINFIFKIGAYKSFSEISPVLQFANFTCNQALIEALERFDRIHVIDFDIGFGVQWSSFMQELVLRGNGTPSLKITAVVSPLSCNEIELNFTRENLSQYAKDLNMPFEFNALHIESLSSPSFPLPGHLFDSNEAVGVNFPVLSFINHPSCFPLALHFLKQLRPKVIVTLDKNSDRIDAPLPTNTVHVLQSYSSLLESLDAVNVNLDVLQKIERHFIQPTINKIVLGHNNRSPDKLPPWRNMFLQSGFSPFTFSNFTEAQAECLVQRAPVRGFQVERKPSSLVLCWQRKELISISTWRC
ncbi:scarecrow-like protein 27 [Vicia villosa]|uniref:scarecrow-like protein 27 n=1 Tax=Vicia villosa TaxID=3911 RepID=UPI00273A8258|nr:scarecrow-like protein 27 [Vicia villosa]